MVAGKAIAAVFRCKRFPARRHRRRGDGQAPVNIRRIFERDRRPRVV